MWGADPTESEQIEWEDVTEAFKIETEKLAPEKMVCTSDFELVKVMHAFEMMDTKMDAGVGYKERKFLEEVIEDGSVAAELNDEKTLDLMYYLMEAEASFLSGNMLVINMLTCVYFHKLTLVTNPFLNAYIEALCSSISSINSVILTSDVREEEEFAPFTFGLSFGEQFPSTSEYISYAVENLEREAESLSKTDDPDGFKSKMVEIAMFRVTLLRAFQALSDRQLPEARGKVIEAQACLEKLKEHKTGSEPTPPVEGAIFLEARHWVVSHCIANTPSNPTYVAAVEKWEQILKEHVTICSAEETCQDLTSLVKYCEEFSGATPRPHLLSRSRLMCLLYENRLVFKKVTMSSLVVDHLTKSMGAPIFQQLMQDPSTPTNLTMLQNKPGTPQEGGENDNLEIFKKFLEGCQRGYLQYIYVLMHNRARLRRKLSNLFADWGLIQQLAWDCDRIVFDGDLIMERAAPVEIAQRTVVLSAFVFDTVLDIMSLFLNLGFELDLYCPSEVREVLWYNQYIGVFQTENLRHMQKTRQITKEEVSALRKAKKMKQHQPIIPPVFATREIRTPPNEKILYLETLGFALKGIVAMSHACINAGLLGANDGRRERYCTPESRYEHRIQPFYQLMKPSFVRYNSYLRHNTYDRLPTETLAEAKRSFDLSLLGTRRAANNSTTWKELEKVVKGNSVSLFLINRMMEARNDEKEKKTTAAVFYDWSYSSSLPVLKPLKKA
eukprot:TRINITY_DN7028_c2_g1_i1.p1 TRINITY_DN7028_c2_g1~~TRINITY_DN7028_c2_g1_i1.p1  ORF type:complete len:741 (+),score=130.38 TRINITY_DN7028_c2_g1_i1:51-2225(+)